MKLNDIFVYPKYPESLNKLFELTKNLWCLWDGNARHIFYRIDPTQFRELHRNPVKFLYSLPEERLEELGKDTGFLYELDQIWERYTAYLEQRDGPFTELRDKTVAYFCMEFGLYITPTYAGGLGILAGDHLKGSSDLSIPLVGVGLLYRYGYFNQFINKDGLQEERYEENNIYDLPIQEITLDDGKPAVFTVPLLDGEVKVKLWRFYVGRVQLILLDTNLPENIPPFRSITDYLYDANRDTRLMQEIVLGFGGPRALELLAITPSVYHLNEGHSAFLILHRLVKLIAEQKLSLDEAYALVRSSTVFTTHTPVEAGNESYPAAMIQKYLAKEVEKLGVSFERFLEFGALHDTKTFWLPAFALRFSHRTNGVSRLHGDVSRGMWQKCFPHNLPSEIPITSVTNGIHYSWISPEIRELFERYMGPDYICAGEKDEIWERIWKISDEEIWDAHMARKRSMINFLRRIASSELSDRGASPRRIKESQQMLQAGTLTIGFARRFASYKRPNLLLWDRERLKRLLTDAKQPVQLVFAGKAHPADEQGKRMIKALIDFAREQGVEDRMLFVENYDRTVAEYIVQGVDVWLNNPIKPQEASGTSGMKAGANGVLNMSVLDGWWPECYSGKNGWAITAGEYYQSAEMRDAADADQIFDLLEEEIVPMYYDRDEQNIPRDWVSMMKSSIYSVAKGFSMVRMLSQYCTELYLPAVELNRELTADERKQLTSAVRIHGELLKHWDRIVVKDVFADTDREKRLFAEDAVTITCYVYLDDMPEDLVSAEIFYHQPREQHFETIPLAYIERYKDKTVKYEGKLKLRSAGLQSYAARLVPRDPIVRSLYPDLMKWRD